MVQLLNYFDMIEANIRHKVKDTKVKVDHHHHHHHHHHRPRPRHRHCHRHSSTPIEVNVTLSRHVPLPLVCKFRLHLLHALSINIFPVFVSKL